MRIITIGLATIASFALTASSWAADLPVKSVPAPPLAYNWTGFYLGVNAGYVMGYCHR
jgi:hypothetical protein